MSLDIKIDRVSALQSLAKPAVVGAATVLFGPVAGATGASIVDSPIGKVVTDAVGCAIKVTERDKVLQENLAKAVRESLEHAFDSLEYETGRTVPDELRSQVISCATSGSEAAVSDDGRAYLHAVMRHACFSCHDGTLLDDELRERVVEAYVSRLGEKMLKDDVLYRTIMAGVIRSMRQEFAEMSTGVGALREDAFWIRKQLLRLEDGGLRLADDAELLSEIGSVMRKVLGEYAARAKQARAGAPKFDIQGLLSRCKKRLIRQRNMHPSFALMQDGFVSDLLPKGVEETYFEDRVHLNRVIKSGNGVLVSFRDFIRGSWETKEQTHVFITGRGGIGKTVALLTFATEAGSIARGIPTVYIRLYDLSQYFADGNRALCIDHYIERNYTPEDAKAIVRIANEPWGNGPNILLLLDGYNEIPPDKRTGIDQGIRTWAARAGTQLVITSRMPGFSTPFKTRRLELQPLSAREVQAYLAGRHVAAPDVTNERLWEVLETPLVLKIYADVNDLQEKLRADYLRIAKADSAGQIIWNCLQRELWRIIDHNEGNQSKADRAAAILLIMPYVCWRMEYAHELEISKDRLREYVYDACVRWRVEESRPESFASVENSLNSFVGDMTNRPFVSSQFSILANETGLLAWNGKVYFLMHQSLRDGLAAIHIRNAMYTLDEKNIPMELSAPISQYIKNLLVDLVEKRPLLRLWETNRTGQQDATVTHNILRTLYVKFDGDLSNLNWSGMDLRGESLFHYRHDTRIRLSTNPKYFKGTKLDAGCFRPHCHTDIINSVCFSPDALWLASGSDDGTVRLWDAATYRQLHVLSAHGCPVETVCFSPDGKLLASGSADGVVRLWNPATGQRLRTFVNNDQGIRSMCFSPDGSMVAIGSACGTVRVWDSDTGSMIASVKYGKGYVTSVCFVAGGLLLAIANSDASVGLWNIQTKLQAGSLIGHAHCVTSTCSSPNGHILASGSSDCSVCLWDIAERKLLRVITGCDSGVRTLCFSPDGLLLASGHNDGIIRMWDVGTGLFINRLGLFGDSVNSISFSPEGSLMASGSRNCAVRIWDSVTGRQVREIGWRGNESKSICFSPDGSLLASGSDDGIVRLWSVRDRCQMHTFAGHPARVNSVHFSHNGKILASGSEDGTILMWDPVEGTQIKNRISCRGRVDTVRFAPHGTFIACNNDGIVQLWDVNTGLQPHTLYKPQGRACSYDFAPDGRTIAIGSEKGSTQLFDLATGCQVGIIWGYGVKVNSVCFSPDGVLIAIGLENGVIWLRDTETMRRVHVLTNHMGSIRSLCFSHDGSVLASGSDDGALRLWDTKTGKRIRSFKGDANGIGCVQFSPDGSIIASSSGDGTVRLWNVRNNVSTPSAWSTHSVDKIELFFGVDLSGLDFRLASIERPHDREVLLQNGVIL